MVQVARGVSKNSNFFVSTPTVGALGEKAPRLSLAKKNRSVHGVHEDLSTELPKVGALRRRRYRGKSTFLEVP